MDKKQAEKIAAQARKDRRDAERNARLTTGKAQPLRVARRWGK